MNKLEKKRVVICIGTRPEAIKMAPVILAYKKQDDTDVQVCVTGQHTDMVTSVLDIFDIAPDMSFDIMGKTKDLNNMTALLLQEFESYFSGYKPDLVLAQGDTATVFAAAMSAYLHQIPFGHVEAGLRTYDKYSPWPEEGFRRSLAPLTSLHFAPTEQSKKHLLQEHITESDIHVVGNTVIDALFYAVEKVDAETNTPTDIPEHLHNLSKEEMVLITGHRRENWGDGLAAVFRAIVVLAKTHPEVQFVFPVHLNPQVQKQVAEIIDPNTKNIHLIDPMPYLSFVWLMKRATVIISDSGGIQEEAPSLGVPVLVTRDTTERPEGVEAGTVLLVGTDEEKIISTTTEMLSDKTLLASFSQKSNPYGDGQSAGRIVDICNRFLS